MGGGGLAQDPYWILTAQAGIRKLQLVMNMNDLFWKNKNKVHKWM